MGLIINKPTPDLKITDLLKQLKIKPSGQVPAIRVHFGGPVENGRGFVLHSTDYTLPDATLAVSESFGMTATLTVLEDIAAGRGPRDSLLALGYAGWGPGQLEAEIQNNGWLTCDAPHDLVFDADDTGKWVHALKVLGINPLMLSSEGGRA